MICKRCGGEIDTRRRREDGSLQCPHCRIVYRPRNPQSQPQSSQRQAQPQKSKKRNGLALIFKAIPWKRKIWKFPLWVWTVIILLILIIGGSPSSNEGTTSQEGYNSIEVEVTQQPIATVNDDNQDWGPTFYATENEVKAYLDTVFAPYEYFNTPFLDYVPDEPNLYIVSVDITVNGHDEAAVKEALRHIESQLENTPYKFDFSLGIMSKSGASMCIASFGSEQEGYHILTKGKTNTYTTIDEIVLEGLIENKTVVEDTKYTNATRTSFTSDFEKCMSYLGYTAPLLLTNTETVNTGGYISTYMSGDWYGIVLWTDENNSSSKITGAMAFSSGDGSIESGEKVMAAFASTLYAFDNSIDASKAISTIVNIMDGGSTYDTDAVTVSMAYTDTTGYTMMVEGKK